MGLVLTKMCHAKTCKRTKNKKKKKERKKRVRVRLSELKAECLVISDVEIISYELIRDQAAPTWNFKKKKKKKKE